MKTKSAKDFERQICRISFGTGITEARFEKAFEIYCRYLHNIAKYLSGDKYPLTPAMALEQLTIKVPVSVYAGK